MLQLELLVPKDYMLLGNKNLKNTEKYKLISKQIERAAFKAALSIFVCYFLCFRFFAFLFLVLQITNPALIAITIPNPMNPYFHLPSSPVIGIFNVALLVISYKHS